MSETIEQFEPEDWKALRQERFAKRERNRESGAELLRKNGIAFTEHNGGAHLVIEPNRYDFWPGTGRWQNRETGRKGVGVRNLLADIKGFSGQ